VHDERRVLALVLRIFRRDGRFIFYRQKRVVPWTGRRRRIVAVAEQVLDARVCFLEELCADDRRGGAHRRKRGGEQNQRAQTAKGGAHRLPRSLRSMVSETRLAPASRRRNANNFIWESF